MLARQEVVFYDHNRTKAIQLSLVLGTFGGHRFYLHQPVRGFVYLSFSWTGIPLVLSLLDAYFLYRMSEEEFKEEFDEVREVA